MAENKDRASNSYNPWQREISSLVEWRVGAWLPWVLLHIPASWIIVASTGPRGGLLPWVLYALFSWTLCLIVIVIFLFRRKNAISYMITITLLVAGPLLSAKYEQYSNRKLGERAEAAAAEVRRLCEEYGGEEIYRTVKGVKGVFQMVAMPPHYDDIEKQYGRRYPWNRAFGDTNLMWSFMGTDGEGYIFMEYQPEVDSVGPPYMRLIYQYRDEYESNTLSSGNTFDIELRAEEILASKKRSRYGWLAEDLTTRKMRDQWIGGGRVKILDLETGEVLAKVTGFFSAMGTGPNPWFRSHIKDAKCPLNGNLKQLIFRVLKPEKDFPSRTTLESLKE